MIDPELRKKLEPIRLEHAKQELIKTGLQFDNNHKRIDILYKGNIIQFWPFSGWHQGKGIKPGRGLQNLLKQLV